MWVLSFASKFTVRLCFSKQHYSCSHQTTKSLEEGSSIFLSPFPVTCTVLTNGAETEVQKIFMEVNYVNNSKGGMELLYGCLCIKDIISLIHFKYNFWGVLWETTDKCDPLLERTDNPCHSPWYTRLKQVQKHESIHRTQINTKLVPNKEIQKINNTGQNCA